MGSNTNDETFLKKLLPVRPKTATGRKKRRKNSKKNENCKAFCVKRKCKKIRDSSKDSKLLGLFIGF